MSGEKKFATADEAKRPVPQSEFQVRTGSLKSHGPLDIGERKGSGGAVRRYFDHDSIPQVLKLYRDKFRKASHAVLGETVSLRQLNLHPNILKAYSLVIVANFHVSEWFKQWLRTAKLPQTETILNSRVALTLPAGCASLEDVWFARKGVDRFAEQGMCVLPSKVTSAMLMPVVLYQLFRAVQFTHENDIIHRDIKPANIILFTNSIDSKEQEWVPLVQLADFGLALLSYSQDPRVQYTTGIITPGYKAPELLQRNPQWVKTTRYSPAVDMWSCGVIMFRMLFDNFPFGIQQLEPEPDQYQKIKRYDTATHLGTYLAKIGKSKFTPTQVASGEASATLYLLARLLAFEPSKRITAGEAVKDPYFVKFHSHFVEIVKRRFPFRLPSDPCLGHLLIQSSQQAQGKEGGLPQKWAQQEALRPWMLMMVQEYYGPNIQGFNLVVEILDNFMSDKSLPSLSARVIWLLASAAFLIAARLSEGSFEIHHGLTATSLLLKLGPHGPELLARLVLLILQKNHCTIQLATLAQVVFHYLFHNKSHNHSVSAESLRRLDLLIFLTLLHPTLRYHYHPAALATGILYVWEQLEDQCFDTCIADTTQQLARNWPVTLQEFVGSSNPLTEQHGFPSQLLTELSKVLAFYAPYTLFPERFRIARKEFQQKLTSYLSDIRGSLRGPQCIAPLLSPSSIPDPLFPWQEIPSAIDKLWQPRILESEKKEEKHSTRKRKQTSE